jgi:mRNA-degrading endonuclease toxin of MazEF toxin-antitoxin module
MQTGTKRSRPPAPWGRKPGERLRSQGGDAVWITLSPQLGHEQAGVTGVVLSDQVRSLDWRGRNAELICRLPDETLSEVVEKLRLLLPGSDSR